MPTGDAYSSGHLVPSLWDLHMVYLLRPILFRTCRYFSGLCSSNIPRYFLDFALKRVQSKQLSIQHQVILLIIKIGYDFISIRELTDPTLKLEPQGALIAHLNTMSTSVIS